MQYDDLSSATTWTSDNDRLPQDYLDGVLAQINAVQPGKKCTEQNGYDRLRERNRRETELFLRRFYEEFYEVEIDDPIHGHIKQWRQKHPTTA